MKKAGQITVELNTDILQRKLKAIAKHAEALAKELEEIDGLCPECGEPMEHITMYAADEPYEEINTCPRCGYRDNA